MYSGSINNDFQMKKLIITYCLLMIGLVATQAQPINKATPQTMRKTADDSYDAGDWYNALEWYQKSYKELRDDDVAYRIAELNYKLRDYRRAESWYKRILKRDKKGKFLNEKFILGRVMKMNGNYEDAVKQLEAFISATDDPKLKALAKSELTGAELAKEMQPVHGLTVKHGGKNINSYSTETSPVLTNDGANVYFSSIKTKEIITLDGSEGDYFSKIYMAGKKDENNWDKPKVLNQQVNRPGYHTGNPKLTPDGNTMFFTRTLIDGDQITESKIYLSNNSGGTWGPARELIGVNGNYIAKHPAIGELFGEEVLFFVSDMDGGYGGDDIYYAKRKADDVFGDPINLGPNINTEGDEISPFYKDGTLYFSSTGHPGLGGFDIFSTTWNGSTWSRPQNMGIGYNSSV
ncbi:MAG TPA: DUF2225 domain-containing protein, partial [Bacteroidetes bacterium]|nr:DUF2225 domain-containing protein [Bacteroidota bacterium]